MYRIAFTGLGSIAKRHVRNVCAYLDSRRIEYIIDLYRSSLGRALPEDIAPLIASEKLYADELSSEVQYDVVFITNPTSMHYETLLKFKDHSKAFFIEKPVFDSTDVDKRIFSELKDKICYVACPLRYNPVLQYVKNHIDLSKVHSARAISSSYLPDWRPGQDYRNTYSAHKDLGGGVAIDLIHEWDYLTWFFETPDTLYTIQTKVSGLEIDSDDVALYIARAKKTMIELHIDYFGRKAIRILQLFMADDTIECDVIKGEIHYMKSGNIVKLDSKRNESHMREIEHFFDIVEGRIVNDNTPEHGFEVLKLAKGEI